MYMLDRIPSEYDEELYLEMLSLLMSDGRGGY